MEATTTSTEEIKLSINVRSLISAYENKASNPVATVSRPRARSLGNALAKDVIVKVNEFQSIDDIENTLEAIEQRLDQYEIYIKEKHVSFQEALFNILTSIFNVDKDNPDQAKALISRTKNNLSFLNTMLPSNNVSQRFETYANYVKKSTDRVKATTTDDSVEIIKTTKSTDLVKEANTDELDTIKPSISVKTLKQKFQPSQAPNVKEGPTSLKRSNTTYQAYSTVTSQPPNVKGEPTSLRRSNTTYKSYSTVTSIKNEEKTPLTASFNNNNIIVEKKIEVHQNKPADDIENKIDDEVFVNNKVLVSVEQLRNIFETKSKENEGGLSLILKEEKPPVTRFNYKPNIIAATSEEDLKRIKVASYIQTIEKSNDNNKEDVKITQVRSYLKTAEASEEEDTFTSSYNNITLEKEDIPSYIRSTSEEPNRLLEILKNEKPIKEDFHYELKINEGDDDTGENVQIASYLTSYDPMENLEYVDRDEDNNDVDDNDDDYVENDDEEDDHWASSSDSVKTGDSIKEAVERFEHIDSVTTNGSTRPTGVEDD